jgi:hypothetical protein
LATAGGIVLVVLGLIFLGGVVSSLFRLSAYARTGTLRLWFATVVVAGSLGVALLTFGLALF